MPTSATVLAMEDKEEMPSTDWRLLSLTEPASGRATKPGKAKIKSWTLVLAARKIPFRLEKIPTGTRIMVPADNLQDALDQIRLFEKENRNWPPPLPETAPLHDNTLNTLCLLFLLATFHNITQFDFGAGMPNPDDWINQGNAHAGKILDGEWWRVVTALTLHADLLHLLGNLVFGGVFMVRLARELGSGLAWFLLLAAGATGNLVNAWLQHPDHRAVGASTAVFGIIGLFSLLSLVRYRKPLWKRWPLPIAAACGLVALLGVGGERTDLGAHLWGFFCGGGLGVLTALFLKRYGRPGPLPNLFFAAGAGALLLGSWYAALT